MRLQEIARTGLVVLLATAIATLAFLVAGGILIALAVAVPVVIVVTVVTGPLFGKAEVTVTRDEGGR